MKIIAFVILLTLISSCESEDKTHPAKYIVNCQNCNVRYETVGGKLVEVKSIIADSIQWIKEFIAVEGQYLKISVFSNVDSSVISGQIFLKNQLFREGQQVNELELAGYCE